MDEELLSRQQPQSLEAEQAVLGSILIDSRCITDVVGIVKPEDFYLQQNREIYEAIYTMFNFSQTIDPVTVLDKLKELGYYHDNSRDYILQLMEITPTAANVARYAAIVQEKSMLRGLNQAATDIQQMVSEEVGTPAEMLESAEKKIYALRKGERGDSLEHIGTTLHKVFDRLTELSQSDSLIPGLSTGLPDVDTVISGLNKSDLILLAARPGMGKTSMALNILLEVGKYSGKSVVFFSLEMSREQLMNRLFASEGGIDSRRLLTGELSTEDWGKVADLSPLFGAAPLYMDDTAGITVAEMKAKLRRVRNLGLVVIDYLQLMSTGRRSDNRVQEVSEITRSLKIMAKELNVPVITLSQLSRGPESRSDHRPMLSDLRESGSIEQDADIVLFLYREAYYEKDRDDQSEAECIVAKNRHGETGSINLRWDGRYTRFFSVDRSRE